MPDEQDRTERKPGYPAERARQGRIVLRALWQRWVFFGALVLVFLLALAVRILFPLMRP